MKFYFNALHYSHATLTSATVPLEPPELVKFLLTPPRTIGFGLSTPTGSTFDILSAGVSGWVRKAKEAKAHYATDLSVFAAIESSFKGFSADADRKINGTSPRSAQAVIGGIVADSVGPAGHGAKLANMLGFTVIGTKLVHEPKAPAACDLDAPTADGANEAVFVEIPNSCIRQLLDKKQTLIEGILRAVLAVSPSDRISATQADYLRQWLESINLASIAPNGVDNSTYAAQSSVIQPDVALLVGLTSDQFELSSDAGKCKSGLGGTKTTITFSATDRFSSTPYHNEVLIVTCYPRLAASAGIGYTTVPKTAFSIAQTAYPLNGSTGVPPAPGPTFQSVYRIASSVRAGHVAGISLLHLCFCQHPSEGINAYFTFGLIAPDGQQLGIVSGLSAGFAHRYYLTLAEHYGPDNVLAGNNSVGNLVPQGFILTTRQQWVMRPAAAFTLGL
ncbi:MAG: hypothetical protein M3R30_09155 [Candidatus Eremiobacteraeota bacterium]|nr:hypothetical protein [Candidatus Eremiobacteraeota bacterium]